MPKQRRVDKTFKLSANVKLADDLQKIGEKLGKLRDVAIEVLPPGPAFGNTDGELSKAQRAVEDAIAAVKTSIGELYVDGGGSDEVTYEVTEDVWPEDEAVS